jgi:hypothetical protein
MGPHLSEAAEDTETEALYILQVAVGAEKDAAPTPPLTFSGIH